MFSHENVFRPCGSHGASGYGPLAYLLQVTGLKTTTRWSETLSSDMSVGFENHMGVGFERHMGVGLENHLGVSPNPLV